jgi:hypothetical protein
MVAFVDVSSGRQADPYFSVEAAKDTQHQRYYCLGIRSPNHARAVGSACLRSARCRRNAEGGSQRAVADVGGQSTVCQFRDSWVNPTRMCWVSRGPYPRTCLPLLLFCEMVPLHEKGSRQGNAGDGRT